MSAAALLFADVVLIVVLARLCGALAVRLAQPAVVGEIVAGILLGPTMLHGELARTLIPTEVRPALGALAGIGVALFMFAIGLEVDHGRTGGMRAAVSVALTATALPLLLGGGLGLLLAGRYHPREPMGFVLFLAVALSVTAFPVLARILTDHAMQHTRLGTLALAAASIADVVAWSLLILVVTVVNPSGASPWRLLLLAPYAAVLLAARPLLRRLLWDARQPHRDRFAVVFVGALASGGITELLGQHFIFGAFVFGLLLPRDDPEGCAEIAHFAKRMGGLLLPVYFVVAGLQVDLSSIDGNGAGVLALILVVAVSGKIGGGFLGARLAGLRNRQAWGMGALMNTRGLTELIILTTGRQLGLLDGELYSLMVVMAVVTTAMTGPLLSLTRPIDIPSSPAADTDFLPAERKSTHTG
ncbi:cation:proton antiporter [Streptomyces sp. NPDC047049]|uniref:cation:proton antiporter n=1 Tax=Streptomyces sp. NPDC047049 TaxID=3156688 RepID=UPI0033EEB1FE